MKINLTTALIWRQFDFHFSIKLYEIFISSVISAVYQKSSACTKQYRETREEIKKNSYSHYAQTDKSLGKSSSSLDNPGFHIG